LQANIKEDVPLKDLGSGSLSGGSNDPKPTSENYDEDSESDSTLGALSALNLTRKKWRLQSSSIEIKFPDSVKSVILSRIDHMDYELSEALKVASCIGYRFEVSLLAYVMRVSRSGIERILDPLKEKGFVEPVMTDSHNQTRRSYKFKEHAVFGSVKTLLMGSQRQSMHQKIFKYLIKTECTDETLLGHHAEEAGDSTMAATFWEKAFTKSLDAFDFNQVRPSKERSDKQRQRAA